MSLTHGLKTMKQTLILRSTFVLKYDVPVSKHVHFRFSIFTLTITRVPLHDDLES